MKNKKKIIAVVLMTYGSPKTLDDIPEYLKNIYGGKDAKNETIAEFRRRYSLIGGSPLLRITKQQAFALEKLLNKNHKNKYLFRAAAGMRFAEPFISNVVAKIAKDADLLIGIIMSPQYSPIIMGGYVRDLEKAVENAGNKNLRMKIAGDWHLQKYFLQSLAQRVKQALNKLPKDVRENITVLFSAHSMPKKVIEKEPKYIDNLKETATKVAEMLNLPENRWMFCYQSAGHTPEEWLKPDFADIMPILKKKGQTHVLIAPVQFLADHLEILYDVGIAAKQQAKDHGIEFARTQSLNTSPLFIKALSAVVKETMDK